MHSKRTVFRRISVILVSVTSIVGLTAQLATASGSPIPPNDASAYASLHGVSLDEAASALASEQKFSSVVSDVFTAMPRGYVESEWTVSGGTITVRPEYVAQALALPRVGRFDVRISGLDAPPFLDQDALARDVSSAIQADFTGPFGVRYDVDSKTVVITTYAATPISARASTAIESTPAAERLTQIASPWASAVDARVRVNVDPGKAPVRFTSSQGGETYGSCTGGFVGYRNGFWGIITAAHCLNKPTTYDGNTTGATYIASGDYDLRFTNVLTGSPQNVIRSNWGIYRSITSTGVVSIGLSLCKFGIATGYTCDSVASFWGCFTFQDGIRNCGLYQTAHGLTAGGDSGGPWFSGSKAYAITTAGAGGANPYDLITPTAWLTYLGGAAYIKTS